MGRRVEATPIDPPVYWLHIPSGRVWCEHRFHRGRVVMRIVHQPPGDNARPTDIRLYRPADDPGTGGSVLGAPHWIRTGRPQLAV